MEKSPPESGKCPGRQALAEIALILAVFFIHAGYPVPDDNEPAYLCKAKHYWDPAWCPGDFFLDSADAHTLFYWTFGWVTRLVSLPATAWIGRVVVWALTAWAWQRLSWRLIPTPLVAVLTAGLFVTLNLRAELAGEWVVGGVEAKGFAYVLVLLGIERALAGRWNTAWLSLGGAAALHVLVGGWAVAALAVAWCVVGRSGAPLRSMLPGLAGGAVLSLAGLIPALALTWGQPPDVAREAAVIYVFERLRHHLAILHLPAAESARRLIHHGMLLGTFAVLGWVRNQGAPTPNPSPVCGGGVRGGGVDRWRLLAVFVLTTTAFAVGGLVIERVTWNVPDVAARVLRYYWFRLTDFALPLGVALVAGAIVAEALLRHRRVGVILLVAALSYTGWHLTDLTLERFDDPRPRGDARLARRKSPQGRRLAQLDFLDACRWIRENTPEGSVVLTPRRCQTFKWRTGRAEIVTRKDIPQDAAGIVEWTRRLQTIHTYVDQIGERQTFGSLAKAGTRHIRGLATEFHFDFVLTRSRPILYLPVVYRNERYAVYRRQTLSSHSFFPR